MKQSVGFTLIELLLSLAIGSILLLVTVPALQDLLLRNKTANAIDRLINEIHLARSVAQAQNQIIAFCGSRDALHCDGQWQTGQIMLIDQSQQVLRIYSGIPLGDRLWWQSSLGANNVLKLAPTGFTDGQRGSFYYCPKVNPNRYGVQIIVADSGRIRVETGGADLETACSTKT